MSKSEKPKCYQHPNKDATHITNLGTAIDLDTYACDRCAKLVQSAIDSGSVPRTAYVRKLK